LHPPGRPFLPRARERGGRGAEIELAIATGVDVAGAMIGFVLERAPHGDPRGRDRG
jgi:hypothetical protein